MLALQNLDFFQNLGPATRLPRGFCAALEYETLRVQLVSSDVLQISISRAGRFDDSPSVALQTPFDAKRPIDFHLSQDDTEIVLQTKDLTLHARRAPFSLRALRADGSLIFATALDASGRSRAYGVLNNQFAVERLNAREDAFYGLGEKTGSFNCQGRDFTLWNTDVMNGGATEEFTRHRPENDPRKNPLSTEFDPYYISIPFFYHHPDVPFAAPGAPAPMSGHFIDNPWRGQFEFFDDTRHRFAFNGGHYTEYIFAGPSMAAILAGYTALTGRMSPPPLWALGHHQCRWYNYTQPQVAELADTYRQRDIPCDVIWLDIDYMNGFRVFTWDEHKFPDPGELIENLRKQGFRMITIIDPGVKYEKGNPLFEEGLEKRLFCETTVGTPYIGRVWPGQTVFPDFSLPETRAWWGRLNAGHVRFGIAGIWNDMNEPATFDGDVDSMRFGHGRFEHARFHNEYATLMAMGTVEGLREAMPGLRTFVLSRAASPGIQRYAANWMGDNISTWEHLRMSLPMAMGLGISGQPFVGADIGGFGRHCGGELLARWYQCAAWTPFFRNHNCMNQRDQYPWSFGSAIEALCRAAIRERYTLMPYLYSAFLCASETGAPIQRPLIFDHQNDTHARAIDDEFLLGEHILVAPITDPGRCERQVYLPGGEWQSWHDGSPREGGRFHCEAAPLERIPVFVRAGAVIPLWPEVPASTDAYHPEDIVLLIAVPSRDGETASILHEDDGLSTDHAQGAFVRTHFTLRLENGTLQLSASVEGQGYPAFRRQRFRIRPLAASIAAEDIILDAGKNPFSVNLPWVAS